MGRIYTLPFSATAVSAAVDAFEINVPSDQIVVVHSAHIGQHSDPGDAESELLHIIIQRSSGVSGSGGTSPAPVPHHLGDAAYGTTCDVLNTTGATTLTLLRAEAFNVQAGYFYTPTPEERIYISPGGRLVWSMSAPADELTMSGSVVFEVLGG